MSVIRRFGYVSLLLCLTAVYSFAQQDKPFNWSLALQNVKSGESVPFSAPVQAKTGDKYRLVIQPQADCFCYVIYESPGGEDVAVIHAGPLKSEGIWYSSVLELTAPRGAESLFVVVSRDEQKTLAQRAAALNNNAGSSQKRALKNEIFRIRSDASKFKEAAEKPVLMGGASRGTPEKSQGVEYSGLGIYVKTVSIEH